MGVMYDAVKNHKHCIMCGCLMDENHESLFCECCQDDIDEAFEDQAEQEDHK